MRTSSWRPVVGGGLAVLAVAWLAYLPLLRAFFRDDDWGWLVHGAAWSAHGGAAHGFGGLTPLFNYLFLAVFQLAGKDTAAPYYALLIGLHGVVSLLVSWLVWELLADRRAALVAGLLYAALFCHHEAVGWVAAGHRPLTAVLVLLALDSWLAARRWGRPALAVAVVAALLAPLAKDEGLVLCLLGPLVAAGVGSARAERPGLWPFALPLGSYAAWRLAFPPGMEVVNASAGASYSLGPHLLGNLVWGVPQMLVPDLGYVNYRLILQRLLPAGLVASAITLSWATILLLGVAALLLVCRGGRLTRVAVLWCYLAFLPFVPFPYEFARAPRYLYLPSVGLALLAAVATAHLGPWLATRPARRRVAGLLLAAMVLANLGVLRLMSRSRLHDSAVRRAAIAAAQRLEPALPPAGQLVLSGFPAQFGDLVQAVPIYLRRPVPVRFSPVGTAPGANVIRFDSL